MVRVLYEHVETEIVKEKVVNKLNELTLTVITRMDAWATNIREERGSQGIEAGGAALAAMAIVAGLIAGGNIIKPAVEAAMQAAADAIAP